MPSIKFWGPSNVQHMRCKYSSLEVTREIIHFDPLLAFYNMVRLQLPGTRIFKEQQSTKAPVRINTKMNESQIRILHSGVSDLSGYSC